MFGGHECEWVCGLDVEEEVLENGSKMSKGVNCQGSRIMFWSRISLMTVSLMVVIPIVGLVLMLRWSFFFLYFCRCESILAVKILVPSLEVGSKIGQGGRQLMVILKPMVV